MAAARCSLYTGSMLRSGAGAEDVLELGGSRVVTRWLDDEILEATYRGTVTEALVAEADRRFWRAAGGRFVRFALLDAGAATGIEGGAAQTGRQWMSHFKAQGGQLIVVIATLSAIRMVVSALLFATGTPVRIVGSRDEALAQITRARTRTSWRYQRP